MKIRLTILTENNKKRNENLTEDKVKETWQFILNMLSSLSENEDKAIVENVEFVELLED
jgi:hypothetical protein